MNRILNDYIMGSECHASAVGFSLLKAEGNPRVIQSYKGNLDFSAVQPFSGDSFIWLASATKTVVAVAALLAIEKGLFRLEDAAAKYVPELAEPDLLLGYENAGENEGRPIIRKAETAITVHHLLTHTSGLTYAYGEKRLKGWAKYNNRRYGVVFTTFEDLCPPLLFEPGTSWVYGPGIDWVGRIIEVTAQCSLEEFCKDNIWNQIGAYNTTFRPALRPDLLSRRLALVQVTRNETIVGSDLFPLAPEADFGGCGLWTTPRDYNSFLWNLFLKEDGLLAPQSLSLITSQQMTSSELLTNEMRLSNGGMLTTAYPKQIKLNMGLGSTIALQDIPGRRPKGSIGGVGLAGVHWWYDPTNRVCGALYLQLAPAGLGEITDLLVRLETAVYKDIRAEEVYESRI